MSKEPARYRAMERGSCGLATIVYRKNWQPATQGSVQQGEGILDVAKRVSGLCLPAIGIRQEDLSQRTERALPIVPPHGEMALSIGVDRHGLGITS